MQEFKKITHTFLSGRLSATLIIPIDIARKYGIDKPANVVVEERDEGILIKKLGVWLKQKNGVGQTLQGSANLSNQIRQREDWFVLIAKLYILLPTFNFCTHFDTSSDSMHAIKETSDREAKW